MILSGLYEYFKLNFSIAGNLFVDIAIGLAVFLIFHKLAHQWVPSLDRKGNKESKPMFIILNSMFNIVMVIMTLGVFRAVVLLENLLN